MFLGLDATRCRFDSLSRKLNISYFHLFALASTQNAALSYVIQQAIPPEFSEK